MVIRFLSLSLFLAILPCPAMALPLPCELLAVQALHRLRWNCARMKKAGLGLRPLPAFGIILDSTRCGSRL
jgi:hypothetical protein